MFSLIWMPGRSGSTEMSGIVGIDPIKALFWAAVLNGVVAVPLMAVIMLMATQSKVMGHFTLPPVLRTMGWLSTLTMGVAVAIMFANW